jgi:alpha-1,3-rhamnosyl/mannosyltransferase
MNASRPLRIGIDARASAEVPAGRGRVVRELLRALGARAEDPHSYLLYARHAWGQAELDCRFSWRLIPSRDPVWHLRAGRAASRECDVFLSTNSYLTPWFLQIPAVVIVYDLLAFEPEMRPKLRSAIVERLTLAPVVRRAAAFIAISNATAAALRHRSPAAGARTVVAPLAVAPAPPIEADEAGRLPAAGFVLAVGTLEPRKNLPRLVEAYSRLDRDLQMGHPLVVVGPRGWSTGETLDALDMLGNRCTLLGHVSEAALAELYRRCALFCYPSLGEGFGLPVIEAMAAGAPVLTSNVSSLPEVGGSAAEYIDPRDVASIAAGLQGLLCDAPRRALMSRAGRERAAEFSWASFAKAVLEVLQAASKRS